MSSVRTIPTLLLLLTWLLTLTPRGAGDEFTDFVRPVIQKHCFKCHGGGSEIRGDVDFTKFKTNADSLDSFELWETAVDLIQNEDMPPSDELQLSDVEKSRLQAWYDAQFVESVAAHPGFHQPRRLSAIEYRNTLNSMLGFALEVVIVEAEQTVAEKSLVLKLLPTDPPGASGFTNDTSGSPLTTNLWDQYSIILDYALEELFSPQRRAALEAYTGEHTVGRLSHAAGKRMLSTWLRRAYRRPVDDIVLAKSLAAIADREGDELEFALRFELKAALMSPAFLFRGLLLEHSEAGPQVVDDHELAERLSYFIWSDMPDRELMRLAEGRQLGEPEVLATQIDRMLASPKSRNLAEHFGVQWFSLNEIDQVSNNPPKADALKSQAVDFLHYLFTEDRPLLELIDSEITFVNPHTIRHYPDDREQMALYRKQRGIEIESVPNQKIRLTNTPERGGLLTMPGVLAMNRGPVIRGTWILERVLGDHLPDPPADVGQVPENSEGQNLTFRERFAMHRSQPTCAVCHDKIDPLGFSLQAYDQDGKFIGARNAGKKNSAKSQLDTSGRLPSGETFEDFEGLKQILVGSQRERVIRTIVSRTLAFALCRKLEYFDQPTVESMVDELNQEDGTFRDLFVLIANSLPFRQTVVSDK